MVNEETVGGLWVCCLKLGKEYRKFCNWFLIKSYQVLVEESCLQAFHKELDVLVEHLVVRFLLPVVCYFL